MNTFYHTAVRMVTIILLLVAAVILSSCDNPMNSDDERSGTAPSISQVVFYRYNSATDSFDTTFTYAIGDTAFVEVYVADPDLDISSIGVKQTHIASGNSDERSLIAEAQSSEQEVYVSASEIIGPTGTWTVEIWVNDQAGNRSNEYSRTITIVN